ncbi:MAG: LysM peptidoglycan-binding domain-containing protein [Alphaproteobacteria bacterium]|nr:LysM peptidoglycan-binding domain-containing protein [Alphaproteobacteria bacterium]
MSGTAGAAPPEPADADGEPTSVWEAIERRSDVPLSEEDLRAVQELADERFAEQQVLDARAFIRQPDPSFYLDPLKALELDPLHLDQIAPGEFDIPIVVNGEVEKWMHYFLGRGRKWYARWLGRSTRYQKLIHTEMAAAGLPKDHFFLAMVESGFSTHARSWASAVGIWQFMSATGRAYGLRVDYWVDDRRDPERATKAAAAYLKELYEQQGDWYLAWASYNGGPSRVSRAIRAHDSRNFWVLAQHDTLPPETRNYVPKILAAAIIGKHPERYGFDQGIEYLPPLDYESVDVEGAVTLDVLARCAEVSEEDLAALNPALLRGATPPQGISQIRVPTGRAESFAEKFAAIPESERVTFRRHTVAKGETLGAIAHTYGVSVSDITAMNRIRDPNRIYPGTELVIPLKGVPPELVAEAAGVAPPSSSSADAATPAAPTTWHTVRRGETLAAIASRYGVKATDIVSWNKLSDPDHIEAGQRLRIEGGSPQDTTPLSYTVRRGDALSTIAQRFGVSVADLSAWNGLRDPSDIKVGQVLKLYSPAASWETYTVQKGDSLGRIASTHGCTVNDIKGWNDLASSTIYPGQSLRIRKD